MRKPYVARAVAMDHVMSLENAGVCMGGRALCVTSVSRTHAVNMDLVMAHPGSVSAMSTGEAFSVIKT